MKNNPPIQDTKLLTVPLRRVMSEGTLTTPTSVGMRKYPTRNPKKSFCDCICDYDKICRRLAELNLLETEFASKLTIIKESVNYFESFADEYNYRDLRANGFWSYVMNINSFFQLVLNELDKPDKIDVTIDLLNKIADGYLILYDHLRLIRDLTKNVQMKDLFYLNDNDEYAKKYSLFTHPYDGLMELYKNVIIDESYFSHAYTSYGTFWFYPSVRKFFDIYILFVALFGGRFPHNIRCLWNKDLRRQFFSHVIQKPTEAYPFNLWDFLDYHFYKQTIIEYMTRHCQTDSITLHIPVQSLFIISKNGAEPCKSSQLAHEPMHIRCRLIKHRVELHGNDAIILHCHGGAFVAHSPDCHEEYLRQWVSNLYGVPILSIDYSLKVAFPISLQEVLDVYLWLISGNTDVKKLIGFHPKRIVFCGDSAGANLVLSLSYILNDINNAGHFRRDILPVSIVLFYPALLLEPLMSASRVSGSIDPLLSSSILFYALGVYTGLNDEIKIEHEKQASLLGGLLDMNQLDTMINYLTHTQQSKQSWSLFSPIKLFANTAKYMINMAYKVLKKGLFKSNPIWFICDEQTLRKRLERLYELAENPYINLLKYKKLDTLVVPLRIITAMHCPLLDDSVTLAKMWKGPVEMKVLDKLPHGFLQLCNISQEAAEASNLCVYHLRKALKLESKPFY